MTPTAESINEQQRIVKERSKNLLWWMKASGVSITNKDGDTVPVVLNEAQRIMHRWRSSIEGSGELMRGIILKARQEGCSTYWGLDQLHTTTTEQNRRAFMMLQDLDAANEFFTETIEFAYDSLHPYFRPPKKSANLGRKMKLANGSRLFVESAAKKGAGRSGKIHKLHCTEMPDWPDARKTVEGLLASVPKRPGTSAVFESTAQGMGDWFHKEWLRATEAIKNGRIPGKFPLFLSWVILSEYERDPRPYELRRYPITVEEEQVAAKIVAELDRLKLPHDSDQIIRKLLFRRDKVEEYGSVASFQQEYPTVPSEAFLLSGTPYYPAVHLARHLERTDADDVKLIAEPFDRFEIVQYDEEAVGKKVVKHYRAEQHDQGRLKMWLPPDALDNPCVVGADVATAEGEDHSAAQILSVDGHMLDQVATWHGDIGEVEFAYTLAFIANWYGRALLAPELKESGHLVVGTLLNQIHYSRLYRDVRIDSITGNQSDIFGFPTNQRTRPAMLGDSLQYVRTFDITLRDEATLDEMLQFAIRNGRPDHPKGGHDDLLIALCIAIYCRSRVRRRRINVTVNQSVHY